MRKNLALIASMALLVACSSTVTSEQTGAGTTSTASVGGAGGAGGAPTSGGGSIGFQTTSSTGTTTTFSCAEGDDAYFVDVSGDGADQHLGSGCDQPMAWAYFFEAPAGGGGLDVHACITPSPVKLVLNAGLLMAGSDNTVTAEYVDGAATSWHTADFGTMTVTTYGAQGQAIDGTFKVTVVQDASDAGAPLTLSGSFHVCHRPDMITP